MNQFNTWLEHAKRGDQLIYYTGALAKDTHAGKTSWAIPIANRAWQAYEDGKVHLVQRRLGPFMYQYIAIRS